jgi:sialidase-1
MKGAKFLTILLVFISATVLAQSNKVAVFTSGTEGYKSFRIPAIISLRNGDLLAFCEGRVNGAADFGDVNIVMKRSKDQGRTWLPLQVVATFDTLQAGGPAPVVDDTDPAYPQGRIFLFYNTGNKNEHEIKIGHGYKEVWYKTSTNNGATWSDAVNITTQVHRPLKPEINPAYNFPQDWRYYANTPGHAIQIIKGVYKERIYVAANHTTGNPLPHFTDYRAHGFYTDDHGKTFHLSTDVNMPGSNENMAVELNNNKLMLNIRNQRGDVKERMVAISSDGGVKWDTAYLDKNLPDPVCQGSILNIGEQKGKTILAFSNCADASRRDNLTLRISYDEGKTWKKNYTIDKSMDNYSRKNDYTAYSDLVKIGKNKIGVLYERNNYHEIIFTTVNVKD